MDNGMIAPDGSTGFSFGAALSYMQEGRLVRRQGWNGKGMHIAMAGGYPRGVLASMDAARCMGAELGDEIKVRPYIVMKDAQGFMVCGWLASQTDMLADDWEVVE
ncbi:MAG: DUF2829 domain-containing protein [Spirochaetes bacterium]|nr:DUF2829 domain-containing protein [Spirochaetota bacterium]